MKEKLQYSIKENYFYDNGIAYPDDYSISFDSDINLLESLTMDEIDYIAISHGGESFNVEFEGNHIGGKGFITAGYAKDFADDVVALYNSRLAEKKFDQDLQRQIDGTLPSGYVYDMGMPGNKLLACGVPELPIQLNSTRLKAKSKDFDHNFELSEVKGLVTAINNPIAVFDYGKNDAARNIIVNIKHEDKNFLVSMYLNPNVDGERLEINSVRNVFPKDTHEWVLWIQQGKLKGGETKKIQAEIDKRRINLADVAYLDLDFVAKVIEKGEYTKFSSNKFDNLVKKVSNLDVNIEKRPLVTQELLPGKEHFLDVVNNAKDLAKTSGIREGNKDGHGLDKGEYTNVIHENGDESFVLYTSSDRFLATYSREKDTTDYYCRKETIRADLKITDHRNAIQVAHSHPLELELFAKLKETHPSKIVFIKMDDRYETYQDDAEKASNILRIPTSKEKGITVLNFPVVDEDKNISRLLRFGNKLAVCSDVEKSKQALGLISSAVDKEITTEVTETVENEDLEDNIEEEEEQTRSRGMHR